MSHAHHHHAHTGSSKTLLLVTLLTLGFAGIEAGVGLWAGSLALVKAPARLAEDLIELIKQHARVKREHLGDKVYEVSITIALVGDSRTGKSETAEKMKGIVNLQGV